MSISSDAQTVLLYLNTDPAKLTCGSATVALDSTIQYLTGRQRSAPSNDLDALVKEYKDIRSEIDTDVKTAVSKASAEKQAEDDEGTSLQKHMLQGDDYEDNPVYDGSGQLAQSSDSQSPSVKGLFSGKVKTAYETEYRERLMRASALSQSLQERMVITKVGLRRVVEADK
jgi:hypothetical protein